MRKPSLISLLKFLLGWPLSILALIFLLKLAFSKSQPLFANINHINIGVLGIGAISFIGYFFLRTMLWKQILKEKGHPIPAREVAYYWTISELRRFIPGNIWAPVSRTLLFSQKKIEKKDIISALAIESQLVTLGTALLSFLSVPFVLNVLLPRTFLNIIIVYIVVFGIALTTILYIFQSRFLKKKLFKRLGLFSLLLSFSLPNKQIKLLSISMLAFFFFALGTYFSIASVAFLHPSLFLQMLGFFALSLLIGYLFLITPMGLGIREGAMTFGLSHLMPFQIAFISSVFARVILICSELIFVSLTTIWYKTEQKNVLKVEQWIAKHSHELILLLGIIVYCAYFITASILRYTNFYAGRFDLGNMSQTVWNTAHGRLFQFTNPDGTDIVSRLAFHADYILILFGPFYKLWPSPRLLLVAQTGIISLGALFIYKIAYKILRNKTISLALSIVYLLNPSIQHTNLFDFHAVTLATTFLLGAFYFLIEEKYVLFVLFAILSGLTKEHVWAILAILSGYVVWKGFAKKSKRLLFLGLVIFLFFFGMFYYLFWYAIPVSRGSSHFALSYYSEFGLNPSAIVKNILFSPQKTLSVLLQGDRLTYLKQLFLPVGFLPIFSLLYLLITLPELFFELLSNNTQLHQIYFQYTATITPFLFISTIFGIRTFRKLFPQISLKLVTCYLLLVTCYSSYFFGPLPGALNPNIDMFIKPEPKKELIRHTLHKIPKKLSVSATNNLGSHLSNREKIFTVPIGIDQADVVAFLLDDPFAQPSPKAQRKMVEKLKQDKKYMILVEKDNFVVFQKRTKG